MINQNYNTLRKSYLFRSLKDTFLFFSINLPEVVISNLLSFIEGQLTNYLKFEHLVPLTGILGLLVFLSYTHQVNDHPVYLSCTRVIHSQWHLESIFYHINISQCVDIQRVVEWGDSIVKSTENRLKSKKKYIARMNELVVVLQSLSLLKLSPQTVLSYVCEGFLLHQSRFFVKFHVHVQFYFLEISKNIYYS